MRKEGKMYSLIFSIVFVLIAAVAILIGVLRGKKNAWQLSVVRIAISLVTAILSAIVSSLVAWFSAKGLLNLFLSGEIKAIVDDVPSVVPATSALMAMFVAPVLFLGFYALFRPLMGLLTKLLTRLFIKITTKNAPEGEQTELESQPDVVDAAPEKSAGSKYLEELYGSAPVATKKQKKEKAEKGEFEIGKNCWIGALCGGLCAFITLCIVLVPAVGFTEVMGDTASVPLQSMSATDESGIFGVVGDVAHGASHNAGTYVVKYTGGGLLYDMMTSYKVNGERATLRKEMGTVKAFANAVVVSSGDVATPEEKAKSIRDVSYAFDKSNLMPVLVSDIGAAASESWGKGQLFHGIKMPSLGAAFDPVMIVFMNCVAGENNAVIKQDVHTFADIIAIYAEHNMLGEIKTNPMNAFSNEEVTSRIMLDLLENPRLYVMVDAFADFGTTMLLESVKVPQNTNLMYDNLNYRIEGAYAENEKDYVTIYKEIFDDYGIRVSDEQLLAAAQHRLGGGDIRAWVAQNVVADEADFLAKTERMTIDKITEGAAEVKNKKDEAEALGKSYKVMSDLMNGMNKTGFDVKNMLRDLGPVLDAFKKTESIGPEKTHHILVGLLQSEKVHDKIGFTVLDAADSAGSITKNAETKGYATMLNSLSLAVDVVSAASSIEKNTQEAVDAMLDDLTPESAEVLQTVTTPEVVSKYGVPAGSSEPIADMISDTFGNLSDAKEEGMSDEQYQKESAAVSDMMNVLMSTGKAGKMFGEDGRTGGSAEKFVNNIMDSDVMSGTMVETVYKGTEEPTNDPLSSKRQMAQEEKDELISALSNRWNASDKSAQTKKEILSIAAIMNVTVEITDSGVSYVEPEPVVVA